MKVAISLLYLLSLLSKVLSGKFEDCLTATDNSSECFCIVTNPFNHIVDCGSNQPILTPLMCVTRSTRSNGDNETFVAGQCPFTGQSVKVNLEGTNIMNITDTVCGGAHRSGQLCGSCEDGYGLAINTFGLECIKGFKCHSYNWIIYFAVEFTVLSVFFLLVVTLNIKVTSECAIVFILFSQTISLPINIVTVQRDWAVQANLGNVSQGLAWLVDIVYGMWSLNIPFGAFHKLCPSQNITTLDAFSVQYVTAAFPLLLILIAYILIKLYQRDFKPVSLLWVPFRSCCIRFRRRIDPQTSIIDAFASFVLLSYIKFTHISLILLAPTPIYDVYGHILYYTLLYNGNIRYFSCEHLWYALLSILILVIFVIPLPLLLTFYSTKCFQKGLQWTRLNSHVLTLFVHAFQSGYKDGSEGETRDCRYFAGINFISRFLIFAAYTFISNYFILYTVLSFIIGINIGLYVIFQPYKRNIFNKMDPLIYIVAHFIVSLAILNSIKVLFYSPSLALQTVFYLCLFIPAVYMGTYISIWIVRKIHYLCQKDVRFRVNTEGQPRTRIGRIFRSFHFQENSLPSPIEDREGRLIHESIEEYSTDYLDYCETPTGTNNTTDRSTVPTDRSTVPTDRSTVPTTTRSIDRSTTSARMHSRLITRRWPLSLREERVREDYIALTDTS